MNMNVNKIHMAVPRKQRLVALVFSSLVAQESFALSKDRTSVEVCSLCPDSGAVRFPNRTLDAYGINSTCQKVDFIAQMAYTESSAECQTT
jgi:hypothetical protein